MCKNAHIYVAEHRGLLVSTIQQKLRSDGYTNILTRTHQELDLTHQDFVDDFFRQERPEFVFLCAGLTSGILANKWYRSNLSAPNERRTGHG